VSGPGGPPPVALVAPSGAGKTTIAHRLVDQEDGRFVFSVSATTRAPRPGEVDGVDYCFVSRDRFQEMVREGELAEYATVHGELYGTPLSFLREARAAGRTVLLDIDVQGALQIRERVPDAVLIFILPPSGSVLLERLSRRGTEDPEQLSRRMRTALAELKSAPDFPHVVINDDLDRAVREVRDIALGRSEGELPSARLRSLVDDMRSEIEAAAEGGSMDPELF
jgi:guanylate kinase